MGEDCAMSCIIFGIAKTGTQTPPMAAKIITEVAPNGADCSCVLAIVPNSIPKPMAANPENKATILIKNKLLSTFNEGKPMCGNRNIATKIIM